MVASLQSADLVTGANGLIREWGTPHGNVTLGGTAGYLPYGLSNNMGMTRTAFQQLGGFDESFAAATDVDLCWRAQEAGLRYSQVPEAVADKRMKEGNVAAFRQHRDFGVDDVLLFRRHRHRGMKRTWRSTAKRAVWLVTAVPRLADDRVRATWFRTAGNLWGRATATLQR